MKQLNSSQRSFLKGEAHHLEPVIFIGKNGVKDGVIFSINKALEARELIKVKFREFKDKKKIFSKQIEVKADCNLVEIIGHVAIFFRRNQDPDLQRYKIPH